MATMVTLTWEGFLGLEGRVSRVDNFLLVGAI